ncbi:MFS transporter [Gandjariella thermophila]|uniref:MFS transporter n=1 Tax=Gandjariella thermophila TaxID=1931992 RepID=A0A4D4J8N9_9PSEU|nr:MFS transporter [Gandjariella thermophila]GDY33031.1 MFS transporter [Gandjariella thermophila]
MADHAAPRPWVVCAGMALESYDWVLYALLVSYLSPSFFGGEVQRSLVYGFGVFAAGFVARPLGGVVLGGLADQRGRRVAMLMCIAAAAVASYGMALTPDAQAIGPAAAILMLLWRLLLGVAHGGEMPVAQTYLYEMSPPRRSGLFSSMFYTFGSLGKLTASLAVAALASLFGPQAMVDGAWRIPFAGGGVAATVFFVLRLRLPDTVIPSSRSDLRRLFARRNSLVPPMLAVCGLTVGVTAAYYLWTAAPTSHALSVLKLRDTVVLWAGASSTAIFALVLPLFGWIADRVGVARVFFCGTVALGALTMPLRLLLDQASASVYWLVLIIASICLASVCSVLPAVLARLFPPQHRTLGQGLPYGLTVAAFGGTTPFFEQLSRHTRLVLPTYVVALLAVSVVTMLVLQRGPRSIRRDGRAL